MKKFEILCSPIFGSTEETLDHKFEQHVHRTLIHHLEVFETFILQKVFSNKNPLKISDSDKNFPTFAILRSISSHLPTDVCKYSF